MPATKTRPKNKKVAPPPADEQEEGVGADMLPTKIKKPLEIEEHEPIIGIEEKPEEDPLAAPVEEDEAAEELSLDGEELNPFGDRWEE